MCQFRDFCIVSVLFGAFFESSAERLWHSYQFDFNHRSREDLVITNVSADSRFTLDFKVTQWKSLRVEQTDYAIGLIDSGIVMWSIKLDESKKFLQDHRVIEMKEKAIEAVIFENWNITLKKSEVVIVIATSNQELLWYRLGETELTKFWSWPLHKNISHINCFQVNYNYYMLVISEYSNQATADLYQFELKKYQNFWLQQTLRLSNPAKNSAISTFGPHYFLSIPQKSLNSLLVYKLSNNRFLPYKNLTSEGIDDVTSFEIGSKTFLAFNGFNAAIYKFSKNGLVEETIVDSHLDSVHYWLVVPIKSYRNEVVLLAQRVLDHNFHKSFVIEVITYNGVRFEEHEDIPCSYFGENIDGLSCLAGEGTEKGIVGASAMAIGNSVALLIPRENAPSELFVLQTAIKKNSNPVENEIQELMKRRNYLDALVKTQEEDFRRIRNHFRKADSNFRNPSERGVENGDIEELKTKVAKLSEEVKEVKNRMEEIKKNEARTRYSTITFNGIVQIEGETKFRDAKLEEIGSETVQDFLEDIVRKDNIKKITTPKIFTDLQVDDLIFERVNNISADNLVFQSNNKVAINGSLVLEQPLLATGNVTSNRVNGIVFEHEVVTLDTPFDSTFDTIEVLRDLTIKTLNGASLEQNPTVIQSDEEIAWDNVKFQTLFLPSSLEVKEINGENFENFLKQLCFRNIDTYIPGNISVMGDVRVAGSAEVEFLNDLEFPDGYVFTDSLNMNITGKKVFTDTLIVEDLLCSGMLDDIDVSKVITLTSPQEVAGKTVFENLEVTERLNVGGKIRGEHASKFLENPTLLTTNSMKSRATFKNLEVKGSIIVSGTFNGSNFETLLSDIIYNDEEEVIVESMKHFPKNFTIRGNLFLNSSSINNVALDSIVTKNTDQLMKFNTINGPVDFDTIEIEGTYGSINVTELDQETVKLTGEQYISATLEFLDPVEVDNLEILETINDLTSEDFLFASKNQEIDCSLNFDSITINELEVNGNFTGIIENFDLETFDRTRLSFTKDQVIEAKYNIKKSTVEEMDTSQINTHFANDLFSYDTLVTRIIDNLVTGKLDLTNLHVSGSVEVDEINGTNTMNLGGRFWVNGLKKHNVTNLRVKGNVSFENLTISDFGGLNFNDFVKNIVFKNETDPILANAKTFVQGLIVEKLVETKKLNNIPIDRILRKHGLQNVEGPLVIEGNVNIANDLVVEQEINNFPANIFSENCQINDGKYRIKGDVLFSRLAHINNLQVNGSIGGKDVQELLDSLVFKNKDFKLPGTTVFEKKVEIEGNLRVLNRVNGIDLPAFVSNVVMITKDSVVDSPVTFQKPVKVLTRIDLGGNLEAKFVNGIDLNQWIKKAVFIDRGLLMGNYSLEAAVIVDSLQIKFLNGVNMDTLIPLKTTQEIEQLSIADATAFGNINVTNLVNVKYYLPKEFANTLMSGVDQDVASDVTFLGNVFVDGNVELVGSLNGMKVDQIVTTNTDQNLTAVYHFKSKVTLEENLTTTGLVNGINVTKWEADGVKTFGTFPQTISDDWTVEKNLVFDNDVSGSGLINGVNLPQLAQELEDKRNFKYGIEKQIVDDYNTICKDLTFMHKKVKGQIYKFDYLENFQLLTFKNQVQYVQHFKVKLSSSLDLKLQDQNEYLLVNEANSCEAHLLAWTNFEFQSINNVILGQVLQIVPVFTSDSFFLVIRNDPSKFCEIEGTNVWQFINGEFLHLANMEPQEILQESAIPATFYGIKSGTVTEFKINPNMETIIKKYRKWELNEENMAFVPRGLATGLAIKTGHKLIRLNPSNVLSDESFDHTTEVVIMGNYTTEFNPYFPSHNDFVVMKVGMKGSKRSLLGVASHEDTSVMGSLDFIKIYEDVIKGKLFQKVPTYKPSSLITLEFGNGETLLAFLEDGHSLQVYEYKGIDGFKRRLSAKLEGSRLFTMTLSAISNKKTIIGVVDNNRVSFVEAVMLGNQLQDEMRCVL